MPASLVLEWLNENEYRAYPLRNSLGKDLLVRGQGVISSGGYSAAFGGYRINGGPDVEGQRTSFLSQLSPGDQLEVLGQRSAVLKTGRETDMTDTTLYVDTIDVSTALGSSSHSYYIVKKTVSADSTNSVDFTMEGLFLDANLIYNTTPGSYADIGKLTSVAPSGSDLLITVYEQPVFTIPGYVAATYPYYARNSAGSLLVVGKAATHVTTPLLFSSSVQFESSVVTVMDGAWRGVTSLSFNGETPLVGRVSFVEGYQLGLIATPAKSSLKISAGRGYGLPIGCSKIFGEAATADCAELISYISSAAPRANFGNLDLIGGRYISIFPDPDRHRIYVGLTFSGADICVAPPARPPTPI